jgi:hypothetical protein
MQRACKIAELFVLAIFLAVFSLPALAYEPATIAQLEQILAAAHGKPDKDLAKQLGELELTERLSTVRLEKLQASLPGIKSRQALLVLSDNSAFHDLPVAELSQLPEPDQATQNYLLNKAASYIQEALPRMIDVVVSRDTSHFDNLKVVAFSNGNFEVPELPAIREMMKTMTEAELNGAPPAAAVVAAQPYHFTYKTSEIITYRNGEEAVTFWNGKQVVPAPVNAPKRPPAPGLSNWGVFGPLLEVAVNDIVAAKTDWGHWEQGKTGLLAVFRYSIPQDQSNYDVQFCCYISGRVWDSTDAELWNVYEAITSYHGEVAIDLDTGAVLRLTIQTDIPDESPIYRADLLVEYAPVELGGRRYFLPARSVTISQAPVPVKEQEIRCPDLNYCFPAAYFHPKDTVVSDTVYHSYHVFRAETRILPTDASDPAVDSPSSFQPQNDTPRIQ